MSARKVRIIGSKDSLFCTRIEWALKLKGVDYEYIQDNVFNKSDLLLKTNPVHKKIPVLLHGEIAISESLVILEYIDETWKDSPLLPHDPYGRAQARLWAKFADEKVLYGVWEACKGEEEGKRKAIESISILEKLIEGNKFFGGDEIGYLDLVVGWLVMCLGVMEEVGGMKLFEADNFPFLHEWSTNFLQNPSIQDCLPAREILMKYFTKIRSLSLADKKH